MSRRDHSRKPHYAGRCFSSHDSQARLLAASCGSNEVKLSFAYLKELFLSSMMRWIVTPQPGMMGTLMAGQVDVLREQMLSTSILSEPGSDNEHAPSPTRQIFIHDLT